MTFQERYHSESTWHGKVLVMEIYHLVMITRDKDWTITKTAKDFDCSIGLVSENLKLANAIHRNDSILMCPTRQEALKRIPKREQANYGYT